MVIFSEKVKVIQMEMILVPAGEFIMGTNSPPNEEADVFNQYGFNLSATFMSKRGYPNHRVRITRPFYLGKHHVTVGEFRAFTEDTGFKTDAELAEKKGAYVFDPHKGCFTHNEHNSWRSSGLRQHEDHPVVNVSWNDAVAFCQWLSHKEGAEYHLPTEAEWEYACRAGGTTRYWYGDDPEELVTVANVTDDSAAGKLAAQQAVMAHFQDDPNMSINRISVEAFARFISPRITDTQNIYIFTSPVGSFRPNEFGLYDMHGNAWQWCSDWYAEDYYGKSPIDDPTGPSSGTSRVLRGGSWFSGWIAARCANRVNNFPVERWFDTGFRVAKTA